MLAENQLDCFLRTTDLSDKFLLFFGFPLEVRIPSVVALIAFDGLVVAFEGLGVEGGFSSFACCVEDYWFVDCSQWESFGIRDVVRVIGARVTLKLIHLAHVESKDLGYEWERKIIRSASADASVLIYQLFFGPM
jgi:hypothetical protein